MEKKLELLKNDEFIMVYRIMEESFPSSEIRTYEKGVQLLDNPFYHIYIVRNNDKSIDAFIAVWEFQAFRFVEHFAVHKRIRGTGMGSEMMQEYLSFKNKPVFLEVEAVDTTNEKRRIAFYRRLGFVLNHFGYLQPALNDEKAYVPLTIMSYPIRTEDKEFLNIKKEIFSYVYGAKNNE